VVSQATFNKVLARIQYKLEAIPKEFDDMVAQVGIPQGPTYENRQTVATVATIAAIQEFGAPGAGIPARPFIIPTAKKERAKWGKIIATGIKKLIKGNATVFDVLDAVGMQAEGDMKATVDSISSPALSPITVLLRKWRKDEGRTITGKTVGQAARAIKDGVDPGTYNEPLNDTHYMIDSIKHAVNKAGSEFKV
jgi:hypothetical protein